MIWQVYQADGKLYAPAKRPISEDSSQILAGWQNVYGNNNTILMEANDGVAFATTVTEYIKGNKKLEITCYK